MAIRLKDVRGLKGVTLQGYQKRKGRFPTAPVEQRTMGGKVFASKAQMLRYADLQLLQRAGKISELEMEVPFKVYIRNPDGMEEYYCTYTADHVYWENGSRVIEEVKSSGTAKDPAYRLRRKAFEIYHGLKVREVVAR
jgi:hypothetical protein